MKFELGDPTDDEDVATTDFVSQEDSKTVFMEKETSGTRAVLVDETVYYVTSEQILQSHSDEALARFKNWASESTNFITPDGTCYFLEDDYDEWLSLGMPNAK